MLYAIEMGIFNYVLWDQFGGGLYDFEGDYFLTDLDGRGGILHWCHSLCWNFWWVKPGHENFLCVAVWQTFGKILPTFVYQIRRKLLRICSSSWTFNFFDILLLFDEHVDHWNFRAIHPRFKRLLFDFRQRIQRLQIPEQNNFKNRIHNRRILLDIMPSVPALSLLRVLQHILSISPRCKQVTIQPQHILNFLNTRFLHGFHVTSTLNPPNILDILYSDCFYLS